MLSKPRQTFDEIVTDFRLLFFEIKMNGYRAGFRKIMHYLKGMLRYRFFYFAPLHIREQVIYRYTKSKCTFEPRCTDCGCKIPQLFYADGQCGGECYPDMMNETDWVNYKIDNNVRINCRKLRSRF